jgi:hypothetical protein
MNRLSFSPRRSPLTLAWRRWVLLAIAPLAVFALALLGGCGGGGAEDSPPPTNQKPEQLKASEPGELLAHVKKLIKDAPGGVPGGIAFGAVGTPTASPGPSSDSARSNTTVQEAGVDEEDLIKTDGTHLYTLYPRPTLTTDAQKGSLGVLDVHARQGATSVVKVGSIELPYDGQANSSAALHHAAAAQRLAVVGQGWARDANGGSGSSTSIAPPIWNTPRVELRLVDVATPAQPVVRQSLSIDGMLNGSRRIGNTLYIVMNHAPRLRAELMSADATVRDAALAQLSLTDIIPAIRVDGGAPVPLLAETDCYTQVANASPLLQISTITAIDLGTLARASRCFVGGNEALYMSASNLYLATSRYLWSDAPSILPWPANAKTDIHQFALAGMALSYRGSGSVDGHLGWDAQRRAYRLGEHNGHLRVLTFTGQAGWFGIADAGAKEPSPATLSVLRENSGSLQTVATLPNAQRPAPLGKPGEQVFGVRFAGERGYVVTFRQVDPLYVLDLSTPADPKAVGVLEVPGFSDYLYPLANGLLLGVGKDANAQGFVQGVKLGLFDVSNPAAPREVASKVYGGRFSRSALDFARQGLNLFERNGQARAALPVAITTDDGSNYQNGLLRVTIDTAAKTWRDAPLLPAPPAVNGVPYELWNDRATQIDDAVFYFSRGQLSGAAW